MPWHIPDLTAHGPLGVDSSLSTGAVELASREFHCPPNPLQQELRAGFVAQQPVGKNRALFESEGFAELTAWREGTEF
jgi:hypothetical protein